MEQTEAPIAPLVARSSQAADSSAGQRARDRSFTSTERKFSESSSEVGTRSSPGVFRGVDQPDFSHALPATQLLQTQASTLQQQQPPLEAVRQTHNPPAGSYGRPFAATPDAAAGGLRTARERPPSSHRTSGASAASNQVGRTPGAGGVSVSYGIAGPVRVAPFVGQMNYSDGSGSPAHLPYTAAAPAYPQATLQMAVAQNPSEPISPPKIAWDRRPVGDQHAAMRRSQSDDSLNPVNSAPDSTSSNNSGAGAYPVPQAHAASGVLQPQAAPRQYPMGPPQAPPPPRPAVRTSRSHQQPFSLVLLAQRPSAPTISGAGGGGGVVVRGLPHSASSPQRFEAAPASSSVVLRSAAVRAAVSGAHMPVQGSRSGSAASTPTSQAPRYSMHLPDADSLSWNSLVRAAIAQPPTRMRTSHHISNYSYLTDILLHIRNKLVQPIIIY